MAIEKEKFFEIIRNVSESEGLNKDNLLERIGSELKGINPGAYSTYNNLKIDKLFMIQDSDKAVNCMLLHLAVECNSVPIVKLLLEKKVKVDEQMSGDVNSKFTALHIAALHGHQEIVQLLLNNNANPSLKDSQGRTPRDIVGDVEGKKAIIKMLEVASSSTIDNENTKASVVERVRVLEGRQKENNNGNNTDKVGDTIHNGEQTSLDLATDKSSDDSGICTESEGEEGIDAKEKQNQKENESLKQKMQDLESEKATLKDKLDKTESQHSNCLEENQLLKQKIQELGNENTKLKDKLDKTESQYSKAEALLEKTQKELEESKSCIARHETKLKQFNKENESLTQKIRSLENENTALEGELGKTKTNEVSLEKVGKRQFSPKVAYASLAAMLVVGAALSIASGLSALLIVAASVVSALIAGGITYTISKPIAELKEVNIQGSAQRCL